MPTYFYTEDYAEFEKSCDELVEKTDTLSENSSKEEIVKCLQELAKKVAVVAADMNPEEA